MLTGKRIQSSARPALVAGLLFCACAEMSGQVSSPADSTIRLQIDSSVIWSRKREIQLKSPTLGSFSYNAVSLRSMVQIAGVADPIRYASMLPGVQTSTELDGSIHILGSENAHNYISIGDAPVYGASHLFGLFSVFNAEHFESMDYSPDAKGISRLGGRLGMQPLRSIPDSLEGMVSVGPLVGYGNITLPLGKHGSVSIAARHSLYIPTLSTDDMSINYGFGDYNMSAFYKPTDRDELQLSLYTGADDALLTSDTYHATIDERWGNSLALASWNHRFDNDSKYLRQSLYASGYRQDGTLEQSTLTIELPNDITSYGYKAQGGFGAVNIVADAIFHDVHPQSPKSRGTVVSSWTKERQRALELAADASYTFTPGHNTSIELGVRIPALLNGDYRYCFADPYIEASLNLGTAGTFKLEAGTGHQFIFRTGLTSTALPMEFHFLAGEYSRPQESVSAVLDYKLPLENGLWEIEAKAYGRILKNQIEYVGQPLDFLNDYTTAAVIKSSDGLNYGACLMLTKLAGNLTGWICYSYGRALRKFHDGDRVFPASHERIHEFNAVANYEAGDWEFGGTLVVAGGTPFTPADYLYYSSGQVIVNYADFNSGRLPLYARLDLSANWNCIRTSLGEGGVNFSLYNALGCPNPSSYSLHIDLDSGEFNYDINKSFLRFLPSASVYFRF